MSKFTYAVCSILAVIRNKVQDITDAVIALKRLKEMEAGKRKPISLEEMMELHGIKPESDDQKRTKETKNEQHSNNIKSHRHPSSARADGSHPRFIWS